MKGIKLVLISFVALFIIATAITLFIPSHVRISRAVNLAASRSSVIALVSDTSGWKRWHPMIIARDTSSKAIQPFIITAPRTTDSTFDVMMQQGSKSPVGSGWRVYTYPSSDSITLQWYMDFHLKWYPWQKVSSLFLEGTYGSMMEQGLNNISSLVR